MFNIGDRVRVKKLCYTPENQEEAGLLSKEGSIIKIINGFYPYYVDIPFGDSKHTIWTEEELEKIQ